MVISNGWDSLQIDYIMAYIQVLVLGDMYMEIPKGYKVDAKGDYKILCNIYGQNYTGCVWLLQLVKNLIALVSSSGIGASSSGTVASTFFTLTIPSLQARGMWDC